MQIEVEIKREHWAVFQKWEGSHMPPPPPLRVPSWDVPFVRAFLLEDLKRSVAIYGFYFTTALTAAPISDGEGGLLEIRPREVARSGVYYITGRLATVDEVIADGASWWVNSEYDNRRMIANRVSNMKIWHYPIMVVVDVSPSHWMDYPFREEDVILGRDGEVCERGDTQERIDYRVTKEAEWKIESAAYVQTVIAEWVRNERDVLPMWVTADELRIAGIDPSTVSAERWRPMSAVSEDRRLTPYDETAVSCVTFHDK